jgi:hypothetical protein
MITLKDLIEFLLWCQRTQDPQTTLMIGIWFSINFRLCQGKLSQIEC